ncbi:MAG TPA: T9SS type A sorting domain-containing protein [Bacteroidia bacterium]|nr:T9SS type A sorting domain-containing protein [Bacteroidia bacterium]
MKNIFKTIILLLPACLAMGQQRMVLDNGASVVISNGTLATPATIVIDNSNANAVTCDSGYIYSENEYNIVQWNISNSTGSYTVPFGYSPAIYLPLTMQISANPGSSGGSVKFSTYHTAALNSSGEPSDVTNLTPFFLPGSPSNSDNSYNIADRFYIIDANSGYTTKPAPDNITFSYISGAGNSEVTSPNTLTESRMMAQRYNSTTNTWSDWFGYGCTDAVSNNIGTVQTGPVPAIDMYRSWSLWDNTISLPVKISGTNSTSGCNGNGTASATVYGGKTPYTYTWSNGNTTSSVNSLSGGTYTLTATDAGGCSSSGTITITQPNALSVSASVTANVSCYGNSNGNATASPGGGASPYTYSWSNGTTTVSTSNPTGAVLTAGSYKVTVTDANGCYATASVSVTQPARFIYVSAGTISNVTCNGSSNGSATATPVGGNSPNTYIWSNASTTFSTVQTPNTLSAGTYTVTVTDNCGVSKTATATINQPNALRDSAKSITNVSCNGGTGGSITLGAKGGTYPYSYLWSTGSTLVTAMGLSAGTYSVVASDQNGCSNTVTGITITQPAAIRDSVASITYPLCNGGKGSVTVGVKGGTSPYSYTWTGGVSTTATANNITSRTYTVTVKDKNSCYSTLVFTLTQPVAIRDTIVSSLKVNVSCNGASNGSATVGVKYGTAPYTYSWSPNTCSTATAIGLSAGVYSITVTDNGGCSSSVATVTITQPSALRDSIKNGYTCSNDLIIATLGVKGGTNPYTYTWSPGGGTKATMSNLSPGTYTVAVTDKNGCSKTVTANLTCSPEELLKKDTDSGQSCCPVRNNIELYPNPNIGQFTLSGLTQGQMIEIHDYTGRKISVVLAFNSTLQLNISDLPNGVYLIRILDKNGTLVAQKKVVKTE